VAELPILALNLFTYENPRAKDKRTATIPCHGAAVFSLTLHRPDRSYLEVPRILRSEQAMKRFAELDLHPLFFDLRIPEGSRAGNRDTVLEVLNIVKLACFFYMSKLVKKVLVLWSFILLFIGKVGKKMSFWNYFLIPRNMVKVSWHANCRFVIT
jgi:hypothetical protein